MTIAERFWAKADKSGACWLWTAALWHNGYARFRIGQRWYLGHRVAYELAYGPIPEGLQIDHVKERGCTNRHCVNPAHLEAVTQHVNLLRGDTLPGNNARKTHCDNGHPLSGDNLRLLRKGYRRCRTCDRERERQRVRPSRAQVKTHATQTA